MSIPYTQHLQIIHTTCYSYNRWKVLHVGSRMVLSGRVFTPDRLRDVNFCDVSDGGRGWWYYVGDGAIWPILSRQYLYWVIYLRYVQRGSWWKLIVAAMEADVYHGWIGARCLWAKKSSGKRAGANLTCDTLHSSCILMAWRISMNSQKSYSPTPVVQIYLSSSEYSEYLSKAKIL